MKKLISLMAALVMTVLLVLPMPASASGNAASEARNGVVRILSVYADGSGAYGSGLAVGEAGEPASIFVTNRHVVEGAYEVYLLLDNEWRSSVTPAGGRDDNLHAVKCELVYAPDAYPDYAILRASREVTERTALPLMPSHNASPADQVFALGYPGAADVFTYDNLASIDDITITSGTISRFTTDESDQTKCIQIDADINQGNSGGPLITEDGNVIGLNTMYFSDGADVKICLAIEIDYVINKLNDLIANGTLYGFTFTVVDPSTAPEPTEPVPVPEPEPSNLPLFIGIGAAVIVVLIVVIVVLSRKKSKKSSAPVVSGGGKTIPHIPDPVFCLKGLDGHYAGQKIAINRDMRLGRNASAEISFPDNTPGVSGMHCVVSPRPNGIAITDLGSTYGTMMPNGTKFKANQRYLLKSGDTFYVGNNRQAFQVVPQDGSAAPSPTGSAADFQVVGMTGSLANRRYTVSRTVRIGRSSANNIVFPDNTPGISGNHCMLIPQGDTVYLVDVGSSYGTFLENGTKLEPQQKYPLKKGDVFYLSGKNNCFRIE